MNFGRTYLLWALGYAIAGMCIGIYMGGAKDHAQLGAHSHILLVGFVISFVYGLIHRLWIPEAGRRLAKVQFYVHQFAALAMFAGLILLFGGVLPEATVGPIVGMASVGVLVGMLLMTYMVAISRDART